MRTLGTPDLLERAIAATGLSARRFALDVLGVDERTLRYWLKSERAIPDGAAIVMRAIIGRPPLAQELTEAHARLVEGR